MPIICLTLAGSAGSLLGLGVWLDGGTTALAGGVWFGVCAAGLGLATCAHERIGR